MQIEVREILVLSAPDAYGREQDVSRKRVAAKSLQGPCEQGALAVNTWSRREREGVGNKSYGVAELQGIGGVAWKQ